MEKFDFEAKKYVVGEFNLPAGGYVAQIKKAEEINRSGHALLQISFDIAEGKYKDFFAEQYRNSTYEDKKWKGIWDFFLPDENSPYIDSQKKTFGNLIYSVENSNSGYKWNWDEASLKGKYVGVLFRNEEYIGNDGTVKTATKCGSVTDVESIRNGSFKPLKDKVLKNRPVETKPVEQDFEEIGDDLPF